MAARHRRLIPFVGAGFSRQADSDRFPGWLDLLGRMIKKFGSESFLADDEGQSLEAMLKVGNNPQAVAETIKARVPRDAYYSFLQEQFADAPERPSAAHMLLFKIGPPLIVTTNYDQLIENAYAFESRQALSVVSYHQPGQVRNKLLNALQRKTPFLFKLHGDIDSPADIILTGTDYEKLKQLQNGYRLLLSSLFYHYTTLFIGFSLSDAEILLHIRNIQEALEGERYPDYALFAEESCSEKEAAEFRRAYGIQVIRYSNGDGKHTGLTKFLQVFTAQIKR